jgi:diaminopimelate epimerase
VLAFAKGHGLGNDYLIVDRTVSPWPFGPAQARAMCDRHRGPGADGVLLVDASVRPFALRILNPDGSEAEKSGNGLRILGAWLHGRGLVGTSEWFDVDLARDRVALCVEGVAADGGLDIRVRMGRASFRGADVGFGPEPGEVLGVPLVLPDGATAAVHTVSLANPHCVVFVDGLDRADFLARAPQLCAHAAFTAGTNVQFAHVADDGRMTAWIWERGAHETLASGSSACAVVAAAVRTGRVPAGRHAVHMPGGTATVEVDAGYAVTLQGPARIIYTGRLTEATTRLFGASGADAHE